MNITIVVVLVFSCAPTLTFNKIKVVNSTTFVELSQKIKRVHKLGRNTFH